MKTFATKEEKKAYYKARQEKENARAEVAAAKDRYNTEINPAGIAAETLNHAVTYEAASLGCNSYPVTLTVAEMLKADGQVSNRFWSSWKGEDDSYGLMRGAMSFKSQMRDAGIAVAKLADGRWTITLNGVSVLA